MSKITKNIVGGIIIGIGPALLLVILLPSFLYIPAALVLFGFAAWYNFNINEK